MSNNVRKCKFYLWKVSRTRCKHLLSFLTSLTKSLLQYYLFKTHVAGETFLVSTLYRGSVNNWHVWVRLKPEKFDDAERATTTDQAIGVGIIDNPKYEICILTQIKSGSEKLR